MPKELDESPIEKALIVIIEFIVVGLGLFYFVIIHPIRKLYYDWFGR